MSALAILPQSDASVAESLAAAVRELDHIAQLGRRLQDRLSPLLRRASEGAFEAQALDDLVQHAQGLSVFLDRLSADCADQWRVSPPRAAAELGLASQRRRLATGEPFTDPVALNAPDGDFELF